MNFQRYLSAKRTVDDRALNRRVEERLAEALKKKDRLRVLEVGAGIGASVERFLGRQWLPDRVSYTALDVERENVATARERLPARAAAQGYAVGRVGEKFVCSRGKRRFEIEFRAADAVEFLAVHDTHTDSDADSNTHTELDADTHTDSVADFDTDSEADADTGWDLLVAHAFVDLVDPAEVLAAFRRNLAPGGLAYCPITFDGGTIFEPVADREFEERLCEAFHRHIDQSGDSRAGRHLLSLASGSEGGDRGTGVVAAGGSDWVVHPRKGGYLADEEYFLHCIVEMVESAVRAESAVEDQRLSEWVARRHEQIEDAELVYCAHQLDLLVR